MVDKALFIGTSSAKESMRQLELITNNLANVGTAGFRADYEARKQLTINEKGQQTRVYSVASKSYSDFQPGPIIKTERPLDIAISGDGFIAVQGKEGREAYTRAGNLQIKNDMLATQSGDLVVGTSGLINIPQQAERVSIGIDGTVTVKIKGATDLVMLNKIKLTEPSKTELEKGTDGLFYLTGENPIARASDKVKLMPGSLEGSNVNAVQTLTDLIELSRNFEFDTDMMKTLRENSTKANELLNVRA